jgi:crotonobetainyl-CoA:carnitine CoA-transferase CaiB-like acyl-CoA transferase
MAGILEGLKVLEMGHVVAAPAAAVMMADWGAEVIKLEPLTGDMARGIGIPLTEEEKIKRETEVYIGYYFQFLNRGKRGIAFNLKEEAGKEILYRLVKWADIFMSNYEKSTLQKLGAGYEELNKVNSRIIYGLLTGYGTVGPDKDERGFDYAAAWARSGIMYMLGEPDSIPSPQRGGMMDRVAGSHMVAGLLAALYHRDRTGRGQNVEFSLYHSGVWTMAEDYGAVINGREPVKHARATARNPLWNNYRTKDEKWFWAAMLQPDLSWGDFCRALGRPEWENDEKYNNNEQRFANREELIRKIDEILLTKTMAEWEVIFRQHNIIYGRAASPIEVYNDPQAIANNFFVDLHHPAKPDAKVVMTPVKFVQDPAEVKNPAPELGQHTEEILLEMGYTWEDIAQFKAGNVIS